MVVDRNGQIEDNGTSPAERTQDAGGTLHAPEPRSSRGSSRDSGKIELLDIDRPEETTLVDDPDRVNLSRE